MLDRYSYPVCQNARQVNMTPDRAAPRIARRPRRLLTFWLPVPLGWAALHFLERRHEL
jgi:hypothetical protein